MTQEDLRRKQAMAHRGDPCKWCNTPHDKVNNGECSGLAWRLPKQGEQYVSRNGSMVEAMADHEEHEQYQAVITFKPLDTMIILAGKECKPYDNSKTQPSGMYHIVNYFHSGREGASVTFVNEKGTPIPINDFTIACYNKEKEEEALITFDEITLPEEKEEKNNG